MTRPLVYISGPFSSPSREIELANTMAAVALGRSIRWVATPLVPHVTVLPIEGIDTQSVWDAAMRECLVYLRHCEAVLMVPGWETSRGARIERERALEWSIPVFTDPDALVAWAREMVAA